MSEKKPLRLLAVNPNLTTSVTETYLKAARAVAPPGVTIDGVTGEFGPSIITTEAENVIAGHSVLDLLAKHALDYDAAILAVSFDSALAGAREIMPIPVIGITESMLHAAAEISDRIGLICLGAASLPLYRRLVRDYAVEEKIACIEVVEIGSVAGFLDPQAQDRSVMDAITGMRQQHGITAAVISGTAIVGMAPRLQQFFDFPVLDGAEPSVKAALTAIDAGKPPVRAFRPLSRCVGISSELAALISGEVLNESNSG